MEINSIAFFQWRLMYPSQVSRKQGNLIDLIDNRIEITFSNLKKNMHYDYPNEESLGIEKRLIKRFKKCFDREGPYNICTFQ